MATLSSLVVKLVGDVSGFDSAMESAGQKVSTFGDKIGDVGKSMTSKVTLPIVGAGAASLIMGNQFNAGLANVISLAPEAASQIESMRGGIQDLAVQTGQSTGNMTAGLYQVVSAFGLSGDSLEVLRSNAVAAAAGLATTEEAINLTSAVTKGYGDTSAAAVQQVADLALKTVQMGQTTFPELAASIGRVTPLAAALGVTQQELFAVMATGTGVTGSAAEVSTQLRGVLQSLMAPTEGMATLIGDLGFSSGQAMLEGLGLQGSIAAVMAAAEATGAPLQTYLGSIEGQTLALALAGPQADTYAQKLAAMGTAAGTADAAFAAQTTGVNAAGFAMQQAAIQGQVLAQQVGNGLGPVVLMIIPYVQQFVNWVSGLIDQFTALDPRIQTAIIAVVAIVAAIGPFLAILGPVVSGIGALSSILGVVGTALGALLSPIGLVVAAVAALAIAWATDFGGIRTMVTQFWDAHLKPIFDTLVTWLQDNIPAALATLSEFWKGTLLPALQKVWGFIQNSLIPLLKSLVMVWLAALKLVLKALQGLWENVLLPAIKKVWEFLQDNILPVIRDVIEIIEKPLTKALEWVKGLFDGVAGAISGITGAIKDVISWLEGLAEKIRNIKLPDWLTPGSPTPFEYGLLGIADAAEVAGRELGRMGATTRAMTAIDMTSWLQSGRDMIDAVLAILGTLSDDAAKRAETLMSALRSVVDGIMSVVQAADAIAGVKIPRGLSGAIDELLAVIGDITARFVAAAAQYNEEQLNAAQSMAQTASAATAALKSMATLVNAMATMTRTRVDAAMAILLDLVEQVVRGFADMAGRLSAEGVTAAAMLADDMRAILDVVKPGIDAITALAGYTATAGIRAAAEAFIADLLRVVRALRNGFGGLNPAARITFEQAGEWAGLVRPIVDIVKPGIDAITALAGYVATENIRASADAFIADLLRVARALRNGFGGLNPAARQTFVDAGEWAGLVRPLLDVLKPGIDALKALGGYVAAENVRARADAFIGDMIDVADAIRLGLGAVSEELIDALTAAGSATERMQKLVGVVKPAVDAIAAVTGYKAAEDLAAGVRAFVADLVVMAQELQAGIPRLDEALTAAYDNAVAFGERAQKLVGVVKPGIDAIRAVAEYTPAANIRAAVQAFVADLVVMGEELRTGLGEASETVLASMDAAIAYGERINRLVGFIRPGIDAVRALAGFWRLDNLRTGTQLFTSAIVAAVEILAGGLTAAPLGQVEAIADWMAGVGMLMAAIHGALTAANELFRTVVSGGSWIWILTVLRRFMETLIQPAFDTGASWVRALADGIRSELATLEDALAQVGGLFAQPGQQWATAGAREAGLFGVGPARPAAQPTSGPVTVNMYGPWNVRDQTDIEAIGQMVADYLSGQTAVQRRVMTR